MAANLTNEINNTDKLTEYIGEARAMGLQVLPPDLNRSEAHFSVVDGGIVYGFLGIKGVGEGVAKAIEAERGKNGAFSSFIEFVERMGTASMNKKTLECLANAGTFDSLGNTRRELVQDIERAVEYCQAKEAAGRYGQASLFDGSGEEEYPPFSVTKAEEYPRADILRIEKELLGFYFSGHPMDEWAKIWERCSDADLAHPERSGADKTYTVIAMLKEFREIFTKAGKKMAFGALEDPAGSIEIVVFADALERWRDKFVLESVLCLKGKIDLTRGSPSFKVEEYVDPASLKGKSWKEVHLRLGSAPMHEEDLYALRDALFDEPGSCNVYFHVPSPAPDADAKEAVVKANVQITCSASEEALERLRGASHVVEAWRD
jgi:DNA polymerase-3 subunit alpha